MLKHLPHKAYVTIGERVGNEVELAKTDFVAGVCRVVMRYELRNNIASDIFRTGQFFQKRTSHREATGPQVHNSECTPEFHGMTSKQIGHLLGIALQYSPSGPDAVNEFHTPVTSHVIAIL